MQNDLVEFISGMQETFDIWKMINGKHHLTGWREKKHIIISFDAERSIWHNSTFHDIKKK